MERVFVPRATRFDFQVPVSFFTDEGTFPGVSKNISESGVSVTFKQEVEIWIVGELTFFSEHGISTLSAKVARLDGREAGLTFKVRSDLDTQAIRDLVTHAEMQPGT